MKANNCDECKHAKFRETNNLQPSIACGMLHRPRFYAPVYLMRDTWGYKRKCEDFLTVTSTHEIKRKNK